MSLGECRPSAGIGRKAFLRVGAVLMVAAIGIASRPLPAEAEETGPATVGVVDQRTGIWYLRDPENGDSTTFYYGLPGDFPFSGDWDCDGVDTPGLYRTSDGYVYLRNSNNQGVADRSFFFGIAGDIPIAGDFDGDGCDTVSVYRPSEGRIYVVNRLGSDSKGLGQAEYAYYFGIPGDRPFLGDFDADGVDEVGLHRGTTGRLYLRFTHTSGPADSFFSFGVPGDIVIAGNWNEQPSDGRETIGLFRPTDGTFYLRLSNTSGVADAAFSFGNQSMVPVAGNFGDLSGGGPAPCPVGPFTTELVSQLAADYAGKTITAHVHDFATGCDFTLNPANRQSIASVFKVMVMAGTLLEAQNDMRLPSDWEVSQLEPMITQSTNPPVRALWGSFGGSPWFRDQGAIFGLGETNIVGDAGPSWGFTTTSARDQVGLLRQVLVGEWGPLQTEYREIAHELMTSIVPSQRWGVNAGVPDDWSVALKNGFVGSTINSVGWVDSGEPGQGYVVAILTHGWPNFESGIAAVERVSRAIAATLIEASPS